MAESTRHAQATMAQQMLRQLVLMVITVATLYPVLMVVKVALGTEPGFGSSLNPFPTEITFANFAKVFGTVDSDGEPLFARQLFNSVMVAGSTTLVGIVMSTTAAYGFSRFEFPGRDVGMKAFLVTQMFPGVVMAVPLYILLDAAHLLDSIWGLTLVYSTTSVPFCVFMLKGYFDTIPKDLEEAALVDGANQWTIFTRVILPLAKPAVAVTALFSFMTAWNEFILAATFLSDERAMTLPVTLSNYVGEHSADWPAFAAGAIIVSVPVMTLFYVLQKHLVGGLTAGGVKG